MGKVRVKVRKLLLSAFVLAAFLDTIFTQMGSLKDQMSENGATQHSRPGIQCHDNELLDQLDQELLDLYTIYPA